MTEDEFAGMIKAKLSENPSWLNTALLAVGSGMNAAILEERRIASLKDQATLAAMLLSGSKRGMAPELRKTLEARVCAAIHPLGQSPVERGFIDAYTGGDVESIRRGAYGDRSAEA